jgi:hypothetical protein
MPRSVRELEILRVAGVIRQNNASDVLDRARREVLAWAQRRAGQPLPHQAWQGESFELLTGGRPVMAASLRGHDTELWALRADDPDKKIAGRTWTTEVTVGRDASSRPRLSLRLIVGTTEDDLEIEPAVPGLIQQICDNCGLSAGGFALDSYPWHLTSDDDVERLVAMLTDGGRMLPVIVASGDERGDTPDRPTIDVDSLARAVVGIAHVVCVPARLTYALSNAFGKLRSVYHGAVRAYLPGFDASADPYVHRLFLRGQSPDWETQCLRAVRKLAARESLRRTRIGHDVVPFATVRSVVAQMELEARGQENASDAERLKAALARIEALEGSLREVESERDQWVGVAHEEEDRAKDAEARANAAAARIQMLQQALKDSGRDLDASVPIPQSWDGFADWCDLHLSGRLVLVPAARRMVKSPQFREPKLVARALLWLAGECRETRIVGGRDLANIPIDNGIQNAPCGNDAFRFTFSGRRLEADWHVKNGGNTRDPYRCLRIYYAWDEVTQMIVVAELPAHRVTGAS